MSIKKLPVGQKLDAEISARVFGRSRGRIWLMQWLRVHPRYSRDWDAAMQVVFHFYGIACHEPGSAAVERYNRYFAKFGESKRGFVGQMIVGLCPSNVCDAALFAVQD